MNILKCHRIVNFKLVNYISPKLLLKKEKKKDAEFRDPLDVFVGCLGIVLVSLNPQVRSCSVRAPVLQVAAGPSLFPGRKCIPATLSEFRFEFTLL